MLRVCSTHANAMTKADTCPTLGVDTTRWVQQQIKVWKDDLQARQEHKEKLERERLATITKQIKEKEVRQSNTVS